MGKITFKRINYNDYEVYFNDEKHSLYIANYKKDLGIYMVYHDFDSICGFKKLSEAKDFVRYCIKMEVVKNGR